METRDPRACTTEQARPQPIEPDTREAAHRYHASLAVSRSEGVRVCGIPHLLVRTRLRGGHPQNRGGDHPNVRLPLTGYRVLIVTTPQEVALGDVRCALTLFREREIPILGLVENMSHLVCEHCGARNAAFLASSLSQNGDPGVSNETLASIWQAKRSISLDSVGRGRPRMDPRPTPPTPLFLVPSAWVPQNWEVDSHMDRSFKPPTGLMRISEQLLELNTLLTGSDWALHSPAITGLGRLNDLA